MYKITISENVQQEDTPRYLDCIVTNKFLDTIESNAHKGGFLRYHIDIWDETTEKKTAIKTVNDFLNKIYT